MKRYKIDSRVRLSFLCFAVRNRVTGKIANTSNFLKVSRSLSNGAMFRQDHGLLSAQMHPDFPGKPYLFLFYSVAPEGW